MPHYLEHDVNTLDGVCIVPAGACLSDELLDALEAQAVANPSGLYPLLDVSGIRADIYEALYSPPYDVIFAGSAERSAVLNMLSNSRLQPFVLDMLNHFRETSFYTYLHNLVVFALSVLLASDVVHDPADVGKLIDAGPVHDLGKLCIPPDLLNEPSPISDPQQAHLREHTLAGYALATYYSNSRHSLAAYIARDHHERCNGSGYPHGLKLTNPLVEAVAVADVYDALISPRPYRIGVYDNRGALETLTDMAIAGMFPSDMVRALIARNRKNKPHFHDIVVSRGHRGYTPDPDRVHNLPYLTTHTLLPESPVHPPPAT